MNFENGEELINLYLKSHVSLLICIFGKFLKVSVEEFDINPTYCVSLSGFKYPNIGLQTLQDKDTILIIENNLRGDISSVMDNCYVKSDEKEK